MTNAMFLRSLLAITGPARRFTGVPASADATRGRPPAQDDALITYGGLYGIRLDPGGPHGR